MFMVYQSMSDLDIHETCGFGPETTDRVRDITEMMYEIAVDVGEENEPIMTVVIDIEPVDSAAKELARLWVEDFFTSGVGNYSYSEYYVYPEEFEEMGLPAVRPGEVFVPTKEYIDSVHTQEVGLARSEFAEWISKCNDSTTGGPNKCHDYDEDVFMETFDEYLKAHPEYITVEKFVFVTEEYVDEEEARKWGQQ